MGGATRESAADLAQLEAFRVPFACPFVKDVIALDLAKASRTLKAVRGPGLGHDPARTTLGLAPCLQPQQGLRGETKKKTCRSGAYCDITLCLPSQSVGLLVLRKRGFNWRTLKKKKKGRTGVHPRAINDGFPFLARFPVVTRLAII